MSQERLDRLVGAGAKLGLASACLTEAHSQLSADILAIEGARLRRKIENVERILAGCLKEIGERAEAARMSIAMEGRER